VVLACVPARAQDIELVSQQQETNFFGWVTFRGYARNIGDRSVKYPKVRITLKKSGKIIQVATSDIVGPTDDVLAPGERGSFDVPTLTKASEFDEALYSFSGTPAALDPALVSGEVHLIAQSLNLIDDGLGNAEFLGEFVNQTNAIVGDVVVRFTLYDAAGDFIGIADTGILEDLYQPGEIRPNQVVPFTASGSARFRDVATWQVEITYVAMRLADQIATPVEETSWGRAKQSTPGQRR
jgi:hypothetical protein